MKVVELPGVKIEDVGSLWYDLLRKGYDVESVGANASGTFVYMADDEEKNPKPIVENWVGKPLSSVSRFGVENRRREIMELLEAAKKSRAERAAARAKEEAERRETGRPELKVSSTGQMDAFGVAEALSNGIDSHTVLIQKVDVDGNVMDGEEELSVATSHKLPVSNTAPQLSGGMAMIQVGPTSSIGDFTIEVRDKSGSMKLAKLSLRFVAQRTEEGVIPAPPLEKNGGILAAIRRILKF